MFRKLLKIHCIISSNISNPQISEGEQPLSDFPSPAFSSPHRLLFTVTAHAVLASGPVRGNGGNLAPPIH